MSFNAAVAEKISQHLKADLTKQSRITFADLDAGVVVTCAVSKEYPDARGAGYWFAFHPHQLEKLDQADKALLRLGAVRRTKSLCSHGPLSEVSWTG